MSISLKFFKALCLSLILLASTLAHAQVPAPDIASQDTHEEYQQITKTDFAEHEKLKNFMVMYGLQWVFYLITQHETIEDTGSFENWYTNPWHPAFDNDTYDFNIFKHAFAGSLYYQFYRSRGYGEPEAFGWTMASSLAFEFAIETVTEPPSLQDIYQTPVFGTVAGMGLERLSNYFHSRKTWANRLVGYILNPFTLLSSSQYKYVTMPVVSKDFTGFQFAWSFE